MALLFTSDEVHRPGETQEEGSFADRASEQVRKSVLCREIRNRPVRSARSRTACAHRIYAGKSDCYQFR